MKGATYFSETHQDARARFTEAAARSSVLATQWREPFDAQDPQGDVLTGRNGEALATECAWFGALDAPNVVIVGSGTHGAEGLAGSGAQLAAIDQLIPQIASDQLAIFMLHGLNPWGCSFERRCDHDGVDIMRNFIDFDAPPPPPSDRFKRYAWALAPDAARGPRRWYADLAVLWCVLRYGVSRLQAEIPAGQYAFPSAPFFGGHRPSWTRRMLERALLAHVGRARRGVAMIDIHTGLGARGRGVLLGEHERLDEPACQRGLAWWGDRYEPEAPDTRPARRFERSAARRTAYRLNGSMPRAIREQIFQDATVVTAVLEFGTIPQLQAMNAVRDDHAVWNAARAAGRVPPSPDDPAVVAARAAMREAFYPSDPAWRAEVAAQSLSAIRDAARGLLAADISMD
ncbi:MAG: M14 family metallopeptidase [Neomegalonema sp.]|nr:M14 family metallopeptidase [Neomegalonema sp.]